MSDRLETFGRGLGKLNARLTPPMLRRLDRWLVTRRPLVWRTGIHWIAWWSLLASACLVGFALWGDGVWRRGWTERDLDSAGLNVGAGALTGVVCWVVFQWRRRVGELPLRRHAALVLLNAAVIMLFYLPGQLFSLALTYRISNSISDGDFQREVDFHQSHGFWECSTTPNGPVAGDELAALNASLFRWGLTTDGSASGRWCSEGEQSIELRDLESNQTIGQLQERLALVSFSKQLWQHCRGPFVIRRFRQLGQRLGMALLLSLMLTVASHPSYAWRRRLLRGDVRGLPVGPRPMRVGWLSRFDHWLLIRNPILWATRVHLLLMFFVKASLAIAGLLLLASPFFEFHALSTAAQVVFMLCVAGWPLAWLVVRRRDLAVAQANKPWLVAGSYVAAILSVPLAALAVVRCFSALNIKWDADTDVALWYGTAVLFCFVGACAIRSYRTRLAAFLFAMLGLLSLSLSGGSPSPLSLMTAGTIGLCGVVVTSMMGRRKRAIGSRAVRRALASGLIVTAPAASICAAAQLSELNFDSEPFGRRMFAYSVPVRVLTCAICCVGLSCLLAALARAEGEPKPE